MTTKRWTPRCSPVTQITTVTITTYDATTTYTLTINGKSVSTLGVTSLDLTAQALQVAFSAATYPEFQEITATSTGLTAVATLNCNTPGLPFVVTGTVSGGTGAMTVATPTACTGPNFWSEPTNWSTGAVPVNGDAVSIDTSGTPILYGLAQSGVTLASLTVQLSFTGTGTGTGTNTQAGIGLPEVNSQGSAPYIEYRGCYLAIGATSAIIGIGSGQGCGRIKLNTGTVQTALTQYLTGVGYEQGLESTQWIGTNASNVVSIFGGDFAAAGYGSDVATIATLNAGATVRCGAGCTLTTVNLRSGYLALNSGATTVSQLGGSLVVYGTGAYTTLTITAGSCYYGSSGTVTTATIGGAISFNGDARPRTFTNVTILPGAAWQDTNQTVTLTNPMAFSGCGLLQVSIDFGIGITLAVTY